jgi:hypothetical protein
MHRRRPDYPEGSMLYGALLVLVVVIIVLLLTGQLG